MKGTTQFLSHSENKVKLSELLTQLEKETHLRNLSADDLVARSAFYLAEFNYIHPFREGNGRMIREFMRLLYEQADMTHTVTHSRKNVVSPVGRFSRFLNFFRYKIGDIVLIGQLF